METNDFLGSFAQENVSFSVQIVRTSRVGQNYWTPMIFVENDRFVTATAENGWEDAPGVDGVKVLVVTADTYATYTRGTLQAWLYDLFCNGFTGNAILVAVAASAEATVTYEAQTLADDADPSSLNMYEADGAGGYVLTTDTTVQSGKTYYARVETPADTSAFVEKLEESYQALKAYGYHKTILAGADDTVLPEYALKLAQLCATDDYLSGAPLLPVHNTDLANDPLYSAISTDGRADAFMGWHSDATRNPALYSLGLALAVYNGSGTPVGNGLDMTASSNITPSNGGVNPTLAQKNILKAAYVQYFKTVGDNTGSVAAETDKTIKGSTYAADWILAYITYMVRVSIAKLITKRNFFKNARSYGEITGVLENYVNTFATFGVLTDVQFTYPAFANLPEAADDEIIVPNAWSAVYVNHLRKVTITGTLYIGA